MSGLGDGLRDQVAIQHFSISLFRNRHNFSLNENGKSENGQFFYKYLFKYQQKLYIYIVFKYHQKFGILQNILYAIPYDYRVISFGFLFFFHSWFALSSFFYVLFLSIYKNPTVVHTSIFANYASL